MLAMVDGITIVSRIDGKLLRTIGIQISQMDARIEDAEGKEQRDDIG